MKISLLSLSILFVILVALGCRKKNTAGLGGSNLLQITVRHHTTILDSVTVYAKFNAIDAPVDISEYEISAEVKMHDGEMMAVFDGLKDGDYYLYGKGWDPSIVEEVEGGIPIELCEETSPIMYNLQVTESGH